MKCLEDALKKYWNDKKVVPTAQEIVIIAIQTPADLDQVLRKAAPKSWIKTLLDEEDGLYLA